MFPHSLSPWVNIGSTHHSWPRSNYSSRYWIHSRVWRARLGKFDDNTDGRNIKLGSWKKKTYIVKRFWKIHTEEKKGCRGDGDSCVLGWFVYVVFVVCLRSSAFLAAFLRGGWRFSQHFLAFIALMENPGAPMNAKTIVVFVRGWFQLFNSECLNRMWWKTKKRFSRAIGIQKCVTTQLQ